VLDLFSGIGGFTLGLERAGMRTIAFCESDPYCRAVLEKHWPGVPIFADVRELARRTYDNEPETDDGFVECSIHAGEDFGDCACIGADQFVDELGQPAVICGGFPCQDVSGAGLQAGIGGERSSLWIEFARLIRELRPRVAIVENVSGLLNRGMGDVLGDLAALGYDAEWHCIPAAAVGAPHRRDRVWIIATDADNAGCGKLGKSQHTRKQGASRREPHGLGTTGRRQRSIAANPEGSGIQGHGTVGQQVTLAPTLARVLGCDDASGYWNDRPPQPLLCGMDARPTDWTHRLRCLGNAVVPQIVELLGRTIVEAYP